MWYSLNGLSASAGETESAPVTGQGESGKKEGLRLLAKSFSRYFPLSLKEAHSVPSHLVGEQSQQPTLMESREQQF